MDIKQHAVITLDVVDSRKMISTDLARFTQLSEDLSKLYIIDQVEIFRGDGLQTKVHQTVDGCIALIAQFCYFKMNKIKVRQALGIGAIELQAKRLAESAGAAYEISGQALDRLKGKSMISCIQFEKKSLNEEWWVHSAVLSDLMRSWSKAQAEAIYYTLIGETQMEIADRFKISQAAIHQRLKSAKIHLLNLLINRYKSCI